MRYFQILFDFRMAPGEITSLGAICAYVKKAGVAGFGKYGIRVSLSEISSRHWGAILGNSSKGGI